MTGKKPIFPQSIIDSFARFLVPEIRAFCESEEGQEIFDKWQEAQGKQEISS